MEQDNEKENDKDFADKPEERSEDEIEKTEDWRNEHGQPSFEFLQSLADEGTPESLEKLRSIAGDLDVTYDEDTPTNELIGMIREATQIDPTDVTT
jgi:hypothetical protein